MLKTIKHLIREGTPKNIREFFAYREGDEYSTKTFSQEGEDILLRRIFGEKRNGFYVDIGAHHPFRFSNTKLLYDRGWRGINIEPNPDMFSLFERYRQRDINLPMGVGRESGALTYYRFRHPALNTFVQDVAEKRNSLPEAKEEIVVRPLRDILDEHLPHSISIDLLTIDAEGMDLEILESNDWEKYKPEWILAEIDVKSLKEALQDPITIYL